MKAGQGAKARQDGQELSSTRMRFPQIRGVKQDLDWLPRRTVRAL